MKYQEATVGVLLNLAILYEDGLGGGKDDAKAVKYYLQSAEEGFMNSQHNLAIKYDNGEGVKKDLTLAVALYQK